MAIFPLIRYFPFTLNRIPCSWSVAMSFLESFNLLSKWMRIFGFNNFIFPTPTSRANLKIGLRLKIFAVLKMCLIALFLIVNNVTLNTLIKFDSTNYSAAVLCFFACSVLFTNLFIEVRYRHRIWVIISGLCEIDSMVRSINSCIQLINCQ